MKCDYRGVKLSNRPGDKIHCPLCDKTLELADRNGRAWAPEHERKEVINVWHYSQLTKGSQS